MGELDPKSTGGQGFDFEDKVGAYFLSFLLIGANPFPSLSLGRLVSVKFQRKVDGWDFDDVILEFESNGLVKHIAFSVKSNSQITANQFPAELVKQVWTQFARTEKNPFRSKHDYLALITSGASTAATEAYRKLYHFASKHRGADLAIHIKQPDFTNQHVRDIYDSFEKPAEIVCSQVSDRAEIIERLLHLDMNFDAPTSLDLREAFENLNESLMDGDAHNLWIKLQNLSKESRSVAGEIRFDFLVKELGSSFQIKGHRDLESDLKKLERLSKTEVEKIKSTLGTNLTIERSQDLASKLKKEAINALVGESGAGKSVLLKQWIEKTKTNVVWLPYSVFKSRTLAEVNAALGLQNDFFDILKYGANDQIIIIDGVDRLSSLEERDLLKSFLVTFQRESQGRHFCVVSSQDQIWKSLLGALSTQLVTFNVIPAPTFEQCELELVTKGIPSLAGVLKANSTGQILRNPKYLDLAVQMAEKSKLDAKKQLSEPVLIRGFWDAFDDGSSNQKRTFLAKFAVEQGDTGSFLTAFENLSANELSLVDALLREGILKAQDDWIRFAHDLYGDWIRQRFLLSQRNETLSKIVIRKNNIYWHQAIRLASLEILETFGLESWKQDVLSLKERGEDVLVDLFLDIAITSFNQSSILESIKDMLFSEDLGLLHRFLERFLAYATTPNPQVMSMREKFGLDELGAARINRLPLLNYWPSLLRFLSRNIQSVSGGRVQMAQISEKWLMNTPFDFPLRREATNIAFSSAKWIFEFKKGPRSYVKDDVDKRCYEALLAAYPDLPNEIEDLCLKLIGLREDGIERPHLPVIPSSAPASQPLPVLLAVTRKKIEKKVYPNGPSFKKDRAFRDACFESENFNCITQFNPGLAGKILLAAIIDEPEEYEDIFDDGWRTNDSLGTDHTQHFYPPLYTKGPFLRFFRQAPREALDALIALTSLVTDQWVALEKKRGREAFGLEVEFDGKKKLWRGDSQVFLWAMDLGHCPDVLVAFLMAAEKWFYEKIDAEEDITPWLDQILEKSESLALIGVLVSVAKYSPKFFLDKLRPLLGLSHIIWWDHQLLVQSRVGIASTIPWSGEERSIANLAMKWSGMKHRGISIEQWAIHFLLNVPDMKEFFEGVRSAWEVTLEKDANSQLEALVCKFNSSNYQIVQLADGTQVWNYVAPQYFLLKHKQRFEQNDAQMNLLMFPTKVLQLLDAISFTQDELFELKKKAEYILKTIGPDADDPILTTPGECKLVIDGLSLVAAHRKVSPIDTKEANEARERIGNALATLWNDPGVAGYPFDRSSTKYDVILAKVIARLAAGSEEEPWIRTQVARLVCGPRSVCVEAFFETSVIAKVDQSFLLEVLALLFTCSKVRTAWRNVEHLAKYTLGISKTPSVRAFLCKSNFLRTKVFRNYNLEDRNTLYENKLAFLMNEFIEGRGLKTWPSWDFDPHSYEFSYGLTLIRAETGGLHLDDFVHAVARLPMKQWTASLKSGWIEFCSAGLNQVSKRLSGLSEEGGDLRSTPYSHETWIIHAFAETYYRYNNAKLDTSLRTFFEVGTSAHHWIDDFGKEFFRIGLKDTENWEGLEEKLRNIFDLAFSIKQLQATRRSRDADEIWCSLAGLDDITIHYMPDETQPLVTKLLPIYERLIKSRSGSSKCLRRFTTLLCKKAAINIRMQGVVIVASQLQTNGLSDYEYRNDASTYSYFLTTLWQENQSELRSNKVAFDSFQQILGNLISIQDAHALELATRVGQTKQ